MGPQTKAVAVIFGTLAVLAVTAFFWITSPTGLHSNADVRPNGLADERPDWMRK